MKKHSSLLNPIAIPVYFFALLILTGAFLLYSPFCHGENVTVKFVDALFIATSSACVTGLATIDINTVFNRNGHVVMMILIQVGGLGIMTFSSLMFFLWRRRTRLSDIIAVGQAMRSDQSFNLGRFLVQLFLIVFALETAGALVLYFLRPEYFSLFSAFFHAVSAFCNAGFAFYSDNLIGFQADYVVNLTIMLLIIFGGLGFAVLFELFNKAKLMVQGQRRQRLSWSTSIILTTTVVLIFGGALVILIGSFHIPDLPWTNRILASFFQSVTSRTAGFNTIHLERLSDFALAFMCLLMFIGAAPGSTAGGIKITTARALLAHAWALVRGRDQATIGRRAVSLASLQTAFTVLLICGATVFFATMILCISEGGLISHGESGGRFLDVMFEVVSAFATVGLTVGLTPKLTIFGKLVITFLMFAGRLGPLVLIAAIGEMQKSQLYHLPEEKLIIG